MAEDLESTEDRPCCAALKAKCLKLRTKCLNLEERKNQFRNAANLVQKQYDSIEQENASLKQALGDLEAQLKDEIEKENGIRGDLEDEVSALKEEIELLKQNGVSGSGGAADGKHHECLESVEKEMNRMKDLFEKEKGRADLEQKNAQVQMQKADDALKKLEKEKKKVSEAQGVAKTEKKNAEKSRTLLEKLKSENDALKSEMASEGVKSEAVDKRLEEEKQETSRARKLAETNMKKAEDYRLHWEKLKVELDAVKSMLTSERLKSETAEKKLEAERQEIIKARKQAETNMKKAEDYKLHLEKLNLELNGVKSTLTTERFKSTAAEKKVEAEKQNTSREKNRADDLTKKLEQESTKVKNIEEELRRCKLAKAHAATPGAAKSIQLISKVSEGTSKDDGQMPPRMKMLLQKDQNLIKEKNFVDSERKKAKKLKKSAKEHKRMALQEKYRADLLSKELEGFKLRLKELGPGPQEFIQYKIFADNCQRFDDNIYQSETVKLLKNQLKLEEMLTKHAKEATKLEVFRNNMLHQELLHLKKECLRLQQRLDMLDNSFRNDSEGIAELEKVGNQTFLRGKFYPGELLASGIDSRLNHPCRGSKRNILQSSAINSSSASIDDQSLVGSPRSGTFCAMTSAELGDLSNPDATMLKLPGKKRMRNSENDVATAINMRSHIRSKVNENAVRHSDCGIIPDVHVPAELLHMKGQLQQPFSGKRTEVHGLINNQKDDHASDIIQENSCEKYVRPCKRRKNSCDGAVINPTHERGGLIPHPHANIDDCHASMNVASLVTDMTHDRCLEGWADDVLGSNRCTPSGIADLTTDYYVKLLDLDKEADEKLYRQAIAAPLSPTLPNIDFYEDEAKEVDNPEILVDESSKNNLDLSSTADAYGDMEKEPSSNMVMNDLVSSELLRRDDSVELLKDTCISQSSHVHAHQIEVSGEDLSIRDVSSSGNEKLKISCGVTSAHGSLLKYYVISSDNRDSQSISRVLQAISSCKPQCCLLDSADKFLQSLITNLNAEDVPMKERVCVFLCIILHAVSEIETGSLVNAFSEDFITSLASITVPIRAALSDVVLRNLFEESCDLAEILALVEDFTQHRKVLVCLDSSAEMQVPGNAKLNLELNGNSISLYELPASAYQLVVLGCLFASICSGIDHTGLVCEASCSIFSMEKFDPAVALAILHAFAHTCGSKYLNLHDYALSMTVIKSLVMFLEKRGSSSNSLSQTTVPYGIWTCSISCPFSEGALPMDSVASLLVNKLQVYGKSVSWTQKSCETMKSLFVSTIEECTGGSGTREVVSVSISEDNLFCFMNILSLVEILASFMGWDWTDANFIGQFCVFSESQLMEDSSAAIFILLGQLGRLGVAAKGYEDIGVKGLRERLSALFHHGNFSKLSLLTQSAVMTAVLGLIPLKFEEIIQSKDETLLALSKFSDAKFIRKWFSHLSKEQTVALKGCN